MGRAKGLNRGAATLAAGHRAKVAPVSDNLAAFDDFALQLDNLPDDEDNPTIALRLRAASRSRAESKGAGGAAALLYADTLVLAAALHVNRESEEELGSALAEAWAKIVKYRLLSDIRAELEAGSALPEWVAAEGLQRTLTKAGEAALVLSLVERASKQLEAAEVPEGLHPVALRLQGKLDEVRGALQIEPQLNDDIIDAFFEFYRVVGAVGALSDDRARAATLEASRLAQEARELLANDSIPFGDDTVLICPKGLSRLLARLDGRGGGAVTIPELALILIEENSDGYVSGQLLAHELIHTGQDEGMDEAAQWQAVDEEPLETPLLEGVTEALARELRAGAGYREKSASIGEYNTWCYAIRNIGEGLGEPPVKFLRALSAVPTGQRTGWLCERLAGADTEENRERLRRSFALTHVVD
jgi:hypothetical protein